jgi:hypothetical protein
MPLVLSGTNGVTFPDSSLQTAAASPYVLKNRIINGAMVIDQRNAGASVTPADGAYTLDRWSTIMTTASKFTIQQNAGSVSTLANGGFTNYLGITSSSSYSVSAGDIFGIQQRIEGFNTSDLLWGTANAKTVTLSFQVYSSLTGTFGGSLINSAANRSYPFTYSIPTANTWTTVSLTIAGDTSGTWIGATNGVGIQVNFGVGGGSTYSGTAGAWASQQKYTATGAQLEQNTSATPFERRLYNQELANCQRYFQKSYKVGTVPGTASTFAEMNGRTGLQGVTTTTEIFKEVKYIVTMRTDTSVTIYDKAGTAGKVTGTAFGVADYNNVTANISETSMTGFVFNIFSYTSALGGISAAWTASAEL